VELPCGPSKNGLTPIFVLTRRWRASCCLKLLFPFFKKLKLLEPSTALFFCVKKGMAEKEKGGCSLLKRQWITAAYNLTLSPGWFNHPKPTQMVDLEKQLKTGATGPCFVSSIT
jgi:hypothetical protein